MVPGMNGYGNDAHYDAAGLWTWPGDLAYRELLEPAIAVLLDGLHFPGAVLRQAVTALQQDSSTQGCLQRHISRPAIRPIMLHGNEPMLEDVVDNLLFEGGLNELDFDQALVFDNAALHQCWGATLATTDSELGFRAGSKCTPGFVRGNNHLKNKFCDNCKRSGVFVCIERVRVLGDPIPHDFSNRHGTGMFTAMKTHPAVGFRVINKALKCKGPPLVVFNCKPPAAIAAPLAPPNDAFVIDGQWVHLRLINGTLVPSLAHEIIRTMNPNPCTTTHPIDAGENDDRGTKRARAPGSITTASPSSPAWSPDEIGTEPLAPRPLHESPPPPRDALIKAHADFGALIAASLAPPERELLAGDEQAALAELLDKVHLTVRLLERRREEEEARSSRQYSATHPQPPTQALEMELLSWPPSPPGTAQSSRRLQQREEGLRALSTSTLASGAERRPSTSEKRARGDRETRGVSQLHPPDSPTFIALVYLYLLTLCASVVLGHALMALLTYLFPDACPGPHEDEPPMVITYAVFISMMLALLLLMAEVAGLVPARYADYHLFSCFNRCCRTWHRKKWSRVSAAEILSSPTSELHIGGTSHAGQGGSGGPDETSWREAGTRWSTWRLCAWVAWAVVATAVTVAGTAIWLLTANATGINVVHQQAMEPPGKQVG